MKIFKTLTITASCFLLLLSCSDNPGSFAPPDRFITVTDSSEQKEYLEALLSWLPPDIPANGRLSFLDETFIDWLERTGELPPDFSTLPSIPFLPDPLIMDEGGMNIPVTNMDQWKKQREWMKRHLEYYITGTSPPPPDNMQVNILEERMDGEIRIQLVELRFGPDHRARLTVELMIPPGEGPFPVFLTMWNHRQWARLAVRRGYIGCIYAGADAKDDTEEYSEIWAGRYDFTRLMRRAWGASRAIDYLYTLGFVDREKIGITGHSRNGKLALMAAAFDERITACIPSSGCTGAEVPWRYTAHKFHIEDIAFLSAVRPSWLHPRLRFFTGREHKLPVDQNHFMALIAPRGLMLSTALTEKYSSYWAKEQVFHASRKVYDFLGSPDNIAIRSRHGLHGIAARDTEDHLDFFDFIFGHNSQKPESREYFQYTFDEWLELSGENVDPGDFGDAVSCIKDIRTLADWEIKKEEVKSRLEWILGDEPSPVTNPGIRTIRSGGRGEEGVGTFLTRPSANSRMGLMTFGFYDQIFGYLYFPVDDQGGPVNNNLPAVIYLHEYDYSKGFSPYNPADDMILSMVDLGYAVFAFDMIGFGNRIEEGTRFYHRHPNWSRMGKIVSDTRAAVEVLVNIDGIDSERIFISGYSLGATAGLFTAALEERVAGVVSVAGFTPMRADPSGNGTEGIMAYSHLHGLMPRLGFFAGNEEHIPVDFNEILSVIAPRPVLVIAPELDRDAHHEGVKLALEEAGRIYSLYGNKDNLGSFYPYDYSRFSPDMRMEMYDWLEDRLRD